LVCLLMDEVATWRSMYVQQREQNSQYEKVIAELRNRENRGEIRVLNVANELRFGTIPNLTGVSLDFFSNFLCPFVAHALPRWKEPTTALLWWMIFFRKQMSRQEIAQRACVSTALVGKKILVIALVLRDTLNAFIALPSVEYWANSRPAELVSEFPNLLPMSIDATKLPIYVPGDYEATRRVFNQKAQQATLRWYILALPNMTIAYKSEVVADSANDATMYKNDTIAVVLQEVYEGYNGYTFAIFGDKGYRGVFAPENFELYLTKSAEKGADPDDLWRPIPDNAAHLDTRVCKHRFVVERVFGQLKIRWPRLTKGGLFHYQIKFIDESITALCAIYNLTVDPRYADGWPEVPWYVSRQDDEEPGDSGGEQLDCAVSEHAAGMGQD